MKKKIAAFTLSEITVTLVIVLVVVMIAYQILRNLQTDFSLFQKNENSSGTLLQSYFCLKKDVDKSIFICKDGNILKMLTQQQDTITYLSNDSMLIRDYRMHTDTLHCSIKEYGFHPSYQADTHNLVNSLKISFNETFEDDIILLKAYSPENLVRFENEIK